MTVLLHYNPGVRWQQPFLCLFFGLGSPFAAFEPPPPTPPAQRLPLHPVSEEKITFPLPLDLWKNALLSGAFVSAVPVGSSSTTFKVRIAPKSKDGFSIQAAWKAKSTLEDGHRRYKSVVAAFRLANRLQLPNVPPAWPHQIQAWLLPLLVRNQDVLSKVLATAVDDRLYGSIVPWLPNFQSIPLENPAWKKVWSGWLDGSIGIPPDQKTLAKEISNLLVFDYIIANYDRFSGDNVGIDTKTKMIVFLDNDTGFLNPQNLNGWGWPTLEKTQRFSKALFDQLQSLTKEELSAVFGEEHPGTPLLPSTVVHDVWERIVHIRTHIAEKQQRDPEALSLDEEVLTNASATRTSGEFLSRVRPQQATEPYRGTATKGARM